MGHKLRPLSHVMRARLEAHGHAPRLPQDIYGWFPRILYVDHLAFLDSERCALSKTGCNRPSTMLGSFHHLLLAEIDPLTLGGCR